jgi:hypothetical protein
MPMLLGGSLIGVISIEYASFRQPITFPLLSLLYTCSGMSFTSA